MGHQSLSLAADAAKQIITIATAVLTLTVTFSKDTLVKNRSRLPFSLATSWVLFLISVTSGVWSLLSITAELERDCPTIWSSNVIVPAYLMSLSFIAGVAFTIIAGWQAINYSLKKNG